MRKPLIAVALVALGIAPGACKVEEMFDDADVQVLVRLDEWSVDPSTPSVAAGATRIGVRNVGKVEHELEVLRTDAAPDALPYDRVAQRALPGLALVKEAEGIDAGRGAVIRVNLKPGQYVLICNIPTHYELGMRAALTVK